MAWTTKPLGWGGQNLIGSTTTKKTLFLCVSSLRDLVKLTWYVFVHQTEIKFYIKVILV